MNIIIFRCREEFILMKYLYDFTGFVIYFQCTHRIKSQLNIGRVWQIN
jgi:hypothetical protein